jgi:hypothetical protein
MVNNEKIPNSFMSNVKGRTIISTPVWGLLLFRNTSENNSVIYPIL